jgi:large subunit ribosomal protein L49
MYLSFLRPLALPRASTLSRFLSTSTTSTSTPSELSPPPQSTSTETAAPDATAGTSAVASSEILSQTELSYRVNRTPSKNLPVYLLAKRGGNLKQTRVRKIEGNIAVLRDDIQNALQMDRKDVVINGLTRQIIIKVSFIKRKKHIAISYIALLCSTSGAAYRILPV